MSDGKNLNQRIIDRIMYDHRFKEIRKAAKSDKENLLGYIHQVRTDFDLTPYWDGLIGWLLTSDELVDSLPLTGGMIDSKQDPITGRFYYLIPIYPETTNENIRSSAKMIRKRYSKRGEAVDIRRAAGARTEAEFMALALHEYGKNNSEIVDVLNTEFDEAYINTEIPTLIHKALQKSLRQDKRP